MEGLVEGCVCVLIGEADLLLGSARPSEASERRTASRHATTPNLHVACVLLTVAQKAWPKVYARRPCASVLVDVL